MIRRCIRSGMRNTSLQSFCTPRSPQHLTGIFRRTIFTAIRDNYNLARLKKRIKDSKAFDPELLRILAGLSGHEHDSFPTPLRKPPPKRFITCLLNAIPQLKHYSLGRLSSVSIAGSQDYPYERSPLSIAASTGYDEVVRQLLERGAPVNIEDNPIAAALLSAVFFDSNFKIPNLLVKNGFSVNFNLYRFPYKEEDSYSALINAINYYLDRNDSNNIGKIKTVYFDHLPQKIKWLMKHGANNPDPLYPISLCLKGMDPYENTNLGNKAFRSAVPLLVDFCDPLQETVSEWPLLHKMVYYQCEEAVRVLLSKGFSANKEDINGLTARDLAKLNMNRTLLGMIDPHIPASETLSKTMEDPYFFAKTIDKLPYAMINSHTSDREILSEMMKDCRGKDPYLFLKSQIKIPHTPKRRALTYDCQRFTTGLPALYKFSRGCSDPETHLLNLYVSPLEKHKTPMATAILNKDAKMIEQLLAFGWNIFIEEDFVKHAKFCQIGELLGVEDVLYDVTTDKREGSKILEMLVSAPHSGVTLSNELEKALRDIGGYVDQSYIFNLFEMGLNSDTYKNAEGRSLEDMVRYKYFDTYEVDDRERYTEYKGHNEMCVIMKKLGLSMDP